MDKQRDQLSNNPGALDTAFSNSMMEDNVPDGTESANAGANDDRPQAGAWPERSSGYQEGGITPGKITYPLPPDPHAPPGPDAKDRNDEEISDFGMNEKVEVGHDPSQLQYGLTDK